MAMEKQLFIAILVCLALVACEPRGTPQKPEMHDHAGAISLLLDAPAARGR
jgi:hypothetical protein